MNLHKIKGYSIQALSAALAVSLLSAMPLSSARTVFADWQEQGTAGETYMSKLDFLSRAVQLYYSLSGKQMTGEVIDEAERIGLIDKSEEAAYLTEETITKQQAAQVLYKAVTAYDHTFTLPEREIDVILDDCYDNVFIETQNKAAFAFMMKYGIIGNKCLTNPYAILPADVAQKMADDLYQAFYAHDSITVGDNKIYIGQSQETLLQALGTPNRIDASEYGFAWYVYHADYEQFIMVGIENEKVCAFFSNAEKLVYQDVKNGEPASMVLGGNAALLTDRNGMLDGVYYQTAAEAGKITEKVRESKQKEFLDILNAYRIKKDLPIFIAHEQMTDDAEAYSKGEPYYGSADEFVSGTAGDVIQLYQDMVVSGQYASVFEGARKHNTYAGAGVWYNDGEVTLTFMNDTQTTINGIRRVSAAELKKAPAASAGETETAQVKTPVFKSLQNEQVFESGTDVIIDLEEKAAERYLIKITNAETGENAVNAYVSGGRTRFIFPAALFEDGIDYTISVSAVDGETLIPSEERTIVYGYAQPPVIISPEREQILSVNSVNIQWQAPQYSDFEIELYRDGQWQCSTRNTGVYNTQLMDLQPGKYTLGISVLRKNTNIIKNTSWVEFEIAQQPVEYETQVITREDGTQQEVQVPKVSQAKARFSSDKYERIFGGPEVYSTQAEADANVVVVQIPVWKLKADGEKYSSVMSLQVHRNIANDVVQIFTEIYNGDEQFPINSVGGYCWRDTATGSRSQHSYGTCIDINPDQNYCVYRSGKTIGSFWKPYDNPYSITPDGDVMKAFVKYGWTWGGNWNSVKDYMHFSYLGG